MDSLALDTMWVLISAFLVFFMQAGFGMVEAGFVRAKNAVSLLMKNMMDFCIASLGFFICGYAIMFGGGLFLTGAESTTELPLHAFWMFQAAFCGAAATIVAGGVAGRMKFVSYLIYSFIISAVIYPLIGHWVWGGGWLSNLGFHDYAGSTVVHATGGFAALVGTVLLKPRSERIKDNYFAPVFGHNLPLAALGVFILWFGWFGFNAGSALGISNVYEVSRIVINTNLAAAAGATVAMFLSWILTGRSDFSFTLNGALSGLVAITAPCAVVSPVAAIIIGSIGGVICYLGTTIVERCRIDDPVGAFTVHGLNGVWGTLAVGLFGQVAFGLSNDGLFYGGGFEQLIIQMLGTFSVAGFTMVSMFIVFKLIDKTFGLRVSKKEEQQGIDLIEHQVRAYDFQ